MYASRFTLALASFLLVLVALAAAAPVSRRIHRVLPCAHALYSPISTSKATWEVQAKIGVAPQNRAWVERAKIGNVKETWVARAKTGNKTHSKLNR